MMKMLPATFLELGKLYAGLARLMNFFKLSLSANLSGIPVWKKQFPKSKSKSSSSFLLTLSIQFWILTCFEEAVSLHIDSSVSSSNSAEVEDSTKTVEDFLFLRES